MGAPSFTIPIPRSPYMTQEKSFKSKAWEFFQSLGKTFMFPVSLLAFMGLLLGVGSSVTSPSAIKSFPFSVVS